MAIGTGIEVTIGDDLEFNVSEYSVVEDSTPLDPSDLTGGFGQITIGVREAPIVKRLMNLPLVLNDGSMGEVSGTVRAIEGNGLGARLRADSRLGQLAVIRTIPPMATNLDSALRSLLAICGITTGIDIADEFALIQIKAPGARENVYDRIKRMCAAYNFEVSLVSRNVVVRRPRGRTAINYRDSSIDWTLDQSNLAQAVSGWYYNTTSGTGLAYPIQGDVDNTQVYQVDAGETQVFEIPMDASLNTVQQPIAVDDVAKFDFSQSVYVVTTSEDSVLNPSEWVRSGGSITAEIMEDTRTLKLTMRGADIPELAPFRIAVPIGENKYYSSLRVRGNGVFWKRELMTLRMREDVDLAPDEMGAQVENEFMETRDQLYHRLLNTAARYAVDTQTLRVTSGGINRVGESGSARYPTIGDLKTEYPGATIGSLKTQLGPKIADWNAKLFALVSDDFDNQAFGNIAGARVLYDGSYYRIRSATPTPRSITYAAERDNTIGDVYRTGETIAQWNARWAGRTVRDVDIAPLQELKDGVATSGFGSGAFGSGGFGV